jgi:hypothetical protein
VFGEDRTKEPTDEQHKAWNMLADMEVEFLKSLLEE